MVHNKIIQCDILVSGGGIAGLTFGLLMAGLGLNVHIIDPLDPNKLDSMKPSGRTVALMNSSLNVIRAAGLGDVESLGAPLEAMRIIDKSSPTKPDEPHDFESFDIGLDQFGYNIPNLTLHVALFKRALAQKNLTLHCPQKLQNYTVENGHVLAVLSDDTTIKAPLLVGADGRKSLVREIAGIKTIEKPYGQSAMTFLINHSHSHNNTATEFHYSSGPLALVPLSGNQSSVVWVEKTARAQELSALSPSDFQQIFADKTGDILGASNLETPLESWPLCLIKAKRLTAPHIALIAEAAHVISPITAQGLNLSLRDVAALAEVLADGVRCGLSLSDPALLRTYEKRRSLDLATRIGGVDGMMRLVSNDIAPLKIMRRAGFKAMDKILPLKQFAMQHGLAPTIDQGRLAQGGAL